MSLPTFSTHPHTIPNTRPSRLWQINFKENNGSAIWLGRDYKLDHRKLSRRTSVYIGSWTQSRLCSSTYLRTYIHMYICMSQIFPSLPLICDCSQVMHIEWFSPTRPWRQLSDFPALTLFYEASRTHREFVPHWFKKGINQHYSSITKPCCVYSKHTGDERRHTYM